MSVTVVSSKERKPGSILIALLLNVVQVEMLWIKFLLHGGSFG